MKTYRLMKGVIVLALAALPFAFGGCGKDDAGNNTNTPDVSQQRTEEFIYKNNLEFYRDANSNHIPYAAFIDTVTKYATDQSIRKIHITPENPHMYETMQQTGVKKVAGFLDSIYTASSQKVSGENTTLYLDSFALSDQTVQQVLHGELRIELLQRQYK